VLGGGGAVSATPLDASGNALAGRVITYASSDPSVVTVSSTGALTTVSVGSATITATSEGQSGNAGVTVIPPPVATVSVGLGAGSLDEGLTTQATAVTLDSVGNVLVGRAIAWSSSNPLVAGVDPSGVVTAARAGTADIIATSEGKSGRATITVTLPPVATVTVTVGSATVIVGGGTTAVAETRDANNKLLSGRVCTWTSSDPAIATVGASSGGVAGIAVGSVSITATCEGKSGSASITVIP
jgi:trimeric autotransporter adhesin